MLKKIVALWYVKIDFVMSEKRIKDTQTLQITYKKNEGKKQQLISGLIEMGFIIEKVHGLETIVDRAESGEGFYSQERVSYYKLLPADTKAKYKATRIQKDSEKRRLQKL